MEKIFNLEFYGIDDYNRPVFKVQDKDIYFGSIVTLVPDEDKGLHTSTDIVNYFIKNPNEIELFGSTPNCEPLGGRAGNWKYNFIYK